MSENHQATKNDWLATKINTGTAVADYEFIDRAYKCHSHWMVGFEPDEIAAYFDITEDEVKRDLQHVQANMTPAAVTKMFNDRQRIRIQRDQSYNYEKLLKDSLNKGPDDYIDKGMNPSGILREYREATGLTERGAGINIAFNKNTQINNPGAPPGRIDNTSGVKSMEDVVRLVIEQDPSCGLEPVAEDIEDQMIIEAQAAEADEESVPLEDTDEHPDKPVDEPPAIENDDNEVRE